MPAKATAVHFLPLDFEDRYPYDFLCRWLSDRPLWPLLGVIGYGIGICWGRGLMARRRAFDAKIPLFLWNLSLSLFAMACSFRAASMIVFEVRLKNWDVHDIICSCDLDNVTAFWAYLFTMSKFLELGDTVFLILRKKPISFLHWYHHASVLVFTWIATAYATPLGKFYVPMNTIVHSFVYSYFTAQTLGVKVPKVVSIGITLLEILQMVMGILVLSVSYYFSLQSRACYAPTLTLVTGGIVYASYFVLFVRFFLQSYVFDSRKKAD